VVPAAAVLAGVALTGRQASQAGRTSALKADYAGYVQAVTALAEHRERVGGANARACRGRDVLDFGYVRRDGTATRRQAEPYRLVQAGYRWYLLARDTGHGDWRTFRADRISAPAATGARFTRVDPPDAAAFVADAITAAPYQFRARVLVHAPVQVIAERVPPNAAVLTADGPDRCLLVAGGDSLDGLAFHLARLGAPVTILEPPELITRARARALAAALTKAATPAPRPDPS
jgi:predicted DNA-binding transcriptional regulator YafY